ncbi:MAG TPA: hypothetical protein VMY37_20660 [Thermoguttaceae bacterium]|nr:hypothetical protein [Thermoguttaceae bacterium]
MSRRSRLYFSRLSVPYALRQDHERRGGRELRRWVAKVPDGVVRVLAGREPIGKGGRLLWHVSVSIAASPGVLEPAFRSPTDREFQRACELVPAVREWSEEHTDGLIRHGFEVKQ